MGSTPATSQESVRGRRLRPPLVAFLLALLLALPLSLAGLSGPAAATARMGTNETPEGRAATASSGWADHRTAVLLCDSQCGGSSWIEQGAGANGFSHIIELAWGGVGYTTVGTGLNTTMPIGVATGRVPLPPGNPGVVIVTLGGNDASQGRSDGDILASQQRLLSDLRARYPQTRIVVNGVMSRSGPEHLRRRLVDRLVIDEAARLGMLTVSVAGWGEPGWFGDDVHLTQVGHDQAGARYAPALRQALAVPVSVAHPFFTEIAWLYSSKITTGYGDGTFRPESTVNRDAMAAFLYRFSGSPHFEAPPVGPFSDMSPSVQFYKESAWLHSTDVATGWDKSSGTEFRPLQPVNRDAMAAFLYRLAKSPSFTPPAQSPFVDVTTTNQFYKEITWLRSSGISTGWTTAAGREFRPLQPVERGAMAAFLHRMDGRV